MSSTSPGPAGFRAVFATDLDGTLVDDESQLSLVNLDALHALGRAGVCRVIATGRSLYSARAVVTESWPIDYLVFSSGAGVVDWHTQELVEAHGMDGAQARYAATSLVRRDLDFMVHATIPSNHRFWYRASASENPDFQRRLARYQGFAEPLGKLEADGYCQLLAIEPPEPASQYGSLVEELASYSVVLTTSPLDHASRWIEIFPAHVSKSQAVARLSERHGVSMANVAALGNDFNDRDLLDWASRSFIVANAPAVLLPRYEAVASNARDGFAEAVGRFLTHRGFSP